MSGCVSSREARKQDVFDLMAAHGYEEGSLSTSHFSLFSAAPKGAVSQGGLVHVVIEGDGYAWVNRYTLSDDPTPKDPIGLRLALSPFAINAPKGVYLARPCQYLDDSLCSPLYWSVGRFRDEVLQSYMEAFDELKMRYGADYFIVSGFSGGAYIALNLAAQRSDITAVNTVAGLLDPNAWSAHQDISRLDVRAPPEALIARSGASQFTHYCGEDDDVIPCILTRKFIMKAQRAGFDNHRIVEVDGADHHTLWKKLD